MVEGPIGGDSEREVHHETAAGEAARTRALLDHVAGQVDTPPPSADKTSRSCALALVGFLAMVAVVIVGVLRMASDFGSSLGNEIGSIGTPLDDAFGCFGDAMVEAGCASGDDVPSASLTNWSYVNGTLCVHAVVAGSRELKAAEWHTMSPAANQGTPRPSADSAPPSDAAITAQDSPQSGDLCFPDLGPSGTVEWVPTPGQTRRWIERSASPATTPQGSNAPTSR